jgi:curved DNA-binding protein CbpA
VRSGEPAFDIDEAALERRYKLLQWTLHPDKSVSRTPQERDFSAEHASHINQAYGVLRRPLSRANYLVRRRAALGGAARRPRARARGPQMGAVGGGEGGSEWGAVEEGGSIVQWPPQPPRPCISRLCVSPHPLLGAAAPAAPAPADAGGHTGRGHL